MRFCYLGRVAVLACTLTSPWYAQEPFTLQRLTPTEGGTKIQDAEPFEDEDGVVAVLHR